MAEITQAMIDSQRSAAANAYEEARQLMHEGRAEDAASALLRGLAAFPAHTQSLYLLGEIAERHSGNMPRAKSLYCSALAIDPAHADADAALRRIYRGE
ncbi:hypothetical protein GCM10011584_34170 [Nocardioides phosphati]|uniref:Tetratricopeptide repeat protein n=1 Tax=Nocardioides phosphati TaxID=1867775 RepID=A0ABQ2NF60_9ACTN|nr:hypothetical protein [Nocardioides phosphati]GGO94046.1 hypothetical protein GCM10011584_34170 [Nocardioides phosphati]